MIRAASLALFLLGALAAAPARAQVGQGLEMTEAGYLDYVVEELPAAALKRGITGTQLRERVEARLRKEGIVPKPSALDGAPYLYVHVNVAGEVFSVRLELQRRVSYEAGGRTHRGYAATWQTGGVGHAPTADYILATLDGALDAFIAQYRAANTR